MACLVGQGFYPVLPKGLLLPCLRPGRMTGNVTCLYL